MSLCALTLTIVLGQCVHHVSVHKTSRDKCTGHAQLLSCVWLCNPTASSPLGSSVHGFPKQEYWSGSCCFLLWGNFSTQELNPSLLLGRQILYHWATRETPCMYSAGQIWHQKDYPKPVNTFALRGKEMLQSKLTPLSLLGWACIHGINI